VRPVRPQVKVKVKAPKAPPAVPPGVEKKLIEPKPEKAKG
jgi:hypothetical protein